MLKILVVEMASGRTHDVASIRLFPEHSLLKAAELLQKASASSQGSKFGLGFWGAPEWGLAASSVAGIVQSLLNVELANVQAEAVSNASELIADAERKASYIAVAEIENVRRGTPSLWRRPEITHRQSDTVVWTRPADAVGMAGLAPPTNRAYIHNGAMFVEAVLENGEQIAIEWSHVESIRLRED